MIFIIPLCLSYPSTVIHPTTLNVSFINTPPFLVVSLGTFHVRFTRPFGRNYRDHYMFVSLLSPVLSQDFRIRCHYRTTFTSRVLLVGLA